MPVTITKRKTGPLYRVNFLAAGIRRISQIGDYRAYVEKHGVTDVLFMQYSLRGVFDNQNDNTLETLLPQE